jgi:hypothetical protein
MYNKVIIITNIKYMPSNVLIDLARMYSYICIVYITTVAGLKATLDKAYIDTDGTFNPVPVYIYTADELHVVDKANLKRYCNGLGMSDVCFKVHI